MRPKTEDRRPKTVRRLARGYFITCLLGLFSFSLSASYGITEITQDWVLNSDYDSDAFRILSGAVIQNGYKLTVKAPGIEIGSGKIPIFIGGTLTSSSSFLNFHLLSQSGASGHSYVVVESIIADSNRQVGLRVTGNEDGEGALYLRGNKSNTFTGNAEVSGRRNHLVLEKADGAIAARGDFLVKDRAIVRFAQSNQTLGTSTITLNNYGVLEYSGNSDITNTFKKLIVENHGVVSFSHFHDENKNSKYHIYLDDLIINQGGHLAVHGWKAGRDFFLVKKTKGDAGISNNLADALTKLSFEGYDRNNIHLEDFNDEYWSISATPEPTTTGAILGAIGIGLWTWRRKRCRRHISSAK